MMERLKQFLKDEEGMGTVEMVVIIALLLGIALLFRKQMTLFVTNVLDSIFANTDTENIQLNPLDTNP